MERIVDTGVAPLVAIQKIKHLVHQHEHGLPRLAKHLGQRFRAGRHQSRVGAQQLHAGVAGDLPGQVHPRGLPAGLRVPRIADEGHYLCFGNRRQADLACQVTYPFKALGCVASAGDVIQRRQRVRLAAAELGDEREHRRRVGRFPGQPP